MPLGKVKFFDVAKGWGFIIPDGGGPDMFVHAKQLGDTVISEGDRVSYTVKLPRKGKGKGKPEASDVRVIKDELLPPDHQLVSTIHKVYLVQTLRKGYFETVSVWGSKEDAEEEAKAVSASLSAEKVTVETHEVRWRVA